jgi:hypothetical protein
MKGILELIKLIYGSKALSKVLGTRTNVIRLPDNELKQYTKKELNIEAASDKLAQKAKADMKELLADYPRMNDAEKLIFEGNLRRLGNKLEVVQKKQGPAADVLEFGTGEKVSPEGIMSLTEKAGQKNPPTTLMGKLESRIKQLEASGEDLSKMKGQTYDEFMNDITQGQRTMIRLEDEGLVRATAREIIDKDIKSKKIKLPKEVEADFKQGGGEPIDVFRQFYGEDALEQLNSMVPDFKQMYSSKEAAEAAIKKFKFKFKADRPPGSISIEDAKKAEQEFNIVPADSEEGKAITEKLIGKPKAPVTELVTAEKIILDMKNMDPMDAMKEANKVLKREGKYKNLKEEDVERIMEDTNDFIFGRDIPEDPEGFATGGRVRMAGGGILKLAMKFFNDNNPVSAYKKYLKYVKETAQKDPAKLAPEMGGIVVGSELIHRGLRRKLKEAKEKNDTDDSEDTTTEDRTEKAGGGVSQGLDYLMGIERRGYQEGSTGLSPDAAETYSEYKARMLEALRKSHGGQKTAYTDVQPDGSSSGISRDLPIEDYFNYMLADAYALGFNPNTGLQFGVDDRGVLTDQYKFEQEMADFKKNTAGSIYTEGDKTYYVAGDGKSYNITGINNLENYKVQGENPDGSWYTKYDIPSSVYGLANGGLKYRINADGSRTLLNTATEQTTPTEDFSDYLNFTTSRGGQYAIEQTTPTAGLYQTINPNILGYAGDPTIRPLRPMSPTVEEQMISPEDALTPEIPSNNVLDQWKAHAEATQAMKGETGLDAIPEYGFQTGYDFQSKFPNLDPRIGAGLASGYQVLTEGLGMFNPNNPNFLNPAATYKTALSDATKNIEGIMAFDQNLMTPEQQENRNKYLKSVGQNIVSNPKASQLLRDIRERAPANIVENIDTAVSSLNPFQQQRYINYAIENPDKAIQAAQRDQDFRTSIQNRDQKQKGGLSYLLGM